MNNFFWMVFRIILNFNTQRKQAFAPCPTYDNYRTKGSKTPWWRKIFQKKSLLILKINSCRNFTKFLKCKFREINYILFNFLKGKHRFRYPARLCSSNINTFSLHWSCMVKRTNFTWWRPRMAWYRCWWHQ